MRISDWSSDVCSSDLNVIEINCYWHHFDQDGDGVPDVSLEPLSRLINTIYAKGMMPCLAVDTYAVGGGQMPAGFWDRRSEARRVGKECVSTCRSRWLPYD